MRFSGELMRMALLHQENRINSGRIVNDEEAVDGFQ